MDRAGEIDHDAGETVWSQLAAILRADIAAGHPPKGKLLPSIRTLQETFGVADSTVKHALAELRESGIIRTVNGRGSYVA
jgi:DNA-binding GntR family transcriptional regulator